MCKTGNLKQKSCHVQNNKIASKCMYYFCSCTKLIFYKELFPKREVRQWWFPLSPVFLLNLSLLEKWPNPINTGWRGITNISGDYTGMQNSRRASIGDSKSWLLAAKDSIKECSTLHLIQRWPSHSNLIHHGAAYISQMLFSKTEVECEAEACWCRVANTQCGK